MMSKRLRLAFVILMGLTIFCILCSGCMSTNTPKTTQVQTTTMVTNQPSLTTPIVTTPVKATVKSESTKFVTYHDPKIGFSLNYPSDWTEETISSNQNQHIIMFLPPDQNCAISITVYTPQQSGKDAKQWANGMISSGPQKWPGFALIDTRDTKISGVPAVTFEFTGRGRQNILTHSQTTLTVEGNNGYMLTYDSFPDSFQKYLGTYQQVLTSFTFP